MQLVIILGKTVLFMGKISGSITTALVVL